MEIKESELKFLNLMGHATSPEREMVLEALILGLNMCLPERIIKDIIEIDKEKGQIIINNRRINIHEYSEIIIIGGGKATALMCLELYILLDNILPIKGSINVPKGQDVPAKMKESTFPIQLFFSSHPIPDEEGARGVQNMFDILNRSPKNALIFVLISGGGSALMTLPLEPLTLSDLKDLNKLLLQCGADITEINTIRKHLDAFKGGRLARAIFPRTAFSLILSDVIGDPLEIIASGPTVPDPSTFSDVDKILNKYGLQHQIPERISKFIEDGKNLKISETPKPEDPCFSPITNLLIGSAKLAEQAYEGYFEAKNIPSHPIETMKGEALEFGKNLAKKLFSFELIDRSVEKRMFYSSGEFTVTLKGKGVGGRNQEMLLGFLIQECDMIIKQAPDYLYFSEHFSYCLEACAFDGIEGNSPAMGAIIDSSTLGKIQKKMEMDSIEQVLDYLIGLANQNNSFELFSNLNDALIVGYTGTNVNDSLILLITKN